MKLNNRFQAALKVLIAGTVQRPPAQVSQQARQFMHGPEPSIVMDNKLLFGKNALITGAGKNIGRSTALEMALQGANVFFTDIDKTALQKLEHELKGIRVEVRGFLSDVSEMNDIDDLYAFLDKNSIAIDILVNNAGIQHLDAREIRKLEPDEWHTTFRTNVFGPAYLTKHISNMMINNGTRGSIVFITSVHDTVIRRIPSYSASKAAMTMTVKELAMELAPHGIRVNGIAPGCVMEDEKGNTIRFTNVPLHNSSINPVYIGRAAVYLSSDYFSKFTTGTTIKIDAGATLHNHLSVLEKQFRL